MAAIQLACTSLRARECDTVFTGGMNIMTNPDIFSGLSKGQFLSKTGSCKTYDNDADGYCRGDGVVTLILKRLEDAIADKDPLLGVIAGIATNHSAEAVSITHPHVDTQKFLFQKVMTEACVDIREVSYVEMHGTGTQAGDGVEMESVSSIFAPRDVGSKRRLDQPLFVGSVKSNIGHGEAASGACALVKVLLMLEKDMIPPHCGIKNKINAGFPNDLRERNLHIAFKSTSLPRAANGKRFIFLNNFSAAGGNTAMLLEDAPYSPAIKPDPRSSQVVIISAKSLSSFRQNLKNLLAWIETHPSVSLPSLAYTTTARRSHYNYRVAVEATDLHHLQGTLLSVIQGPHSPVSSMKPKVAFVFTGQGTQYLGMAKELFKHAKDFRLDILSYDRIARGQGFPSFIGLVDGSTTEITAVSPIAVQLAIVCVEIALARLWKSWGVLPAVVIGHSLGEYAALHIAGVLSLFDTINLVGQRAQLMVTTCSMNTHGMLAVRSDFATVKHLLSDFSVETACINGPEEIVFATLAEEIDKLEKSLRMNGFKGTKLNVPYAFHSSQVEPLIDSFALIAKSATFHEPQIPIISPLMREVIDRPGLVHAEYLARHCRESVDFLGGLDAALRADIIDHSTVFVEIGPHPICSNMIKANLGPDTITAPALRRNEDAWKTSTGSLSTLFNIGHNINWSQYHQQFDGSHEILALPSYSFDEKVYWIDYKEDWCLRKGEKLISDSVKPAFSTTSIQRIVYEEVKGDSAVIIGESDLTDPLLRTAISGHLVNGIGLCPSSIYADMAYTICDYAYRAIRPQSTEVDMNVGSMETHKPLVVDTAGKPEQQILQIEVQLNLSQSRATVAYRSSSSDGKTCTDYAKCLVTFGNSAEWSSDWARLTYFVKGRIDSLLVKDGAHRIHRGMAYKLFSVLVNYDNRYRGMEEVILDSENLEATASISFQTTKADGSFYMSPYLIDSVAHVSGFIMNANDALDSKKNVYISHGWKSMMFARRLDPEKKYRSYVKMQPVAGAGQMVAGDVYVFEGEEIVGVISGLKFQCVPRVHLEILLKPATAILQSKTTTTSQVVSGRPLTSRPSPETVISKAISKELKFTTKVKTIHPAQTSSDITDKALRIIADEVGCHISELADTIGFSDLGVDSLMSLCVSGRFREELEIDVHSTLFTDVPTVGQLKSFLQQFEIAESAGSSTPDMGSSTSVTSDSDSDFPQFSGDATEVQGSDSIIHIIRSTIAEEMGMNFEEITDTTDLATIGMDSLMSLAILGALRERTGLTLDSDILIGNTSVEKIEKSLGLRVETRCTKFPGTTILSTASPVPSKVQMEPLSLYPPAQSILLQGNTKIATQNLFLLPDGSGSATSYTTIPTISPLSLCVYGLNCPFMKDPASFTIGVRGVTQIYLNEIKRRQPHGPYLLGGWSAGGVLAFELTRQLLAQGETVSKLILIDSPCPLGLEALPASFHKFCDSIGLLGNGEGPGKIPSWLLPHFAASVRELTAYSEFLDTQVIDTSGMPFTTAIWARDGIVKQEGDPKPEWDEKRRMPNSMKWLVENRKDLGPNGWENLLGKGKVECVSTTGNHFTMMKAPIVSTG
jgi:iterative type I PKS product template protein